MKNREEKLQKKAGDMSLFELLLIFQLEKIKKLLSLGMEKMILVIIESQLHCLSVSIYAATFHYVLA